MTCPGRSVAPAGAYTIVEDASLARRNTLRVVARAALLVDVHRDEALPELDRLGALRARPLLVLGDGSNVLFAGDWPGLVLSLATRGIDVLDDDGDRARVRVAAGEAWDDFVHWSLARGFAGLENLVRIPGTVGAAPIQNIGAYGVEVAEFIDAVEVWDRERSTFARIAASDCAFAYRDSLFKREPDRYLVVAVEFVLPRRREPRIDYAGIGDELAALGPGPATPPRIAEAIARLRGRKLPDPAQIGNAGSFFKNPLVDAARAERLKAQHPGLPVWPAGASAKLSAAWLIEAVGLKGLRRGDAGISDRHALVLVNHGNASGAELLALANHVVEVVEARFGVRLEPEPRIVGV